MIRLRCIHRIRGADPFKESIMRLRDAAITVEDHQLWKTHEIDAQELSSTELWPEAGNLLEEALVLVTSVLSPPFRSTSALFGNGLFYRYHSGRTIRSTVLEPTLLVEPTVLPPPFW
jgi:hypothetical protein